MDLKWILPMNIYRIEKRDQPFLKGYTGLYIYSADSSVDKMKNYICDTYYGKEGPVPEIVDIIPTREDYDPTKDSIHLIHRLRHLYERFGIKKKSK